MAKLVYGVFSVKRCWKLYTTGGPAQTFACRRSAVSAGQSAVRLALSRGDEVELYLQKADGQFERADMRSLAH